MVRDLEELRLRVLDERSRQYVSEAIQCYGAGAYRAAVVLAMAAGMDDLRRKVNELAAQGGASKELRDLQKSIEKAFKDQKAFEQNLIDGCGEIGAGLYDPAESAKLTVLLKTRHLCAHPSGHQGSAEEARDVISSAVDLILSRPALMGMSGIASVLERMENSVFFASNKLDSIVTTTRAELRKLHSSCLPALVARCTERLRKETEDSGPVLATGNSPIVKNIQWFLIGLTNIGDDPRKEVWTRVGTIVEHKNLTYPALRILTHDPAGLALCDELTRGRAIALVRSNLRDPLAAVVVREWRAASVLTDAESDGLLLACRARLVQEPVDLQSTKDAVLKLNWEEVTSEFIEELLRRISSTGFKMTGAAIDVIINMSVDEAEKLTDEQKMRFVLAVALAAGGNTYRARNLCNACLGDRRVYVEACATTLPIDSLGLAQLKTDWYWLAVMLLAAGQKAVVLRLVKAFGAMPYLDNPGATMLSKLSGTADEEVAAAATEAFQEIRQAFLASPPGDDDDTKSPL